MQESMKIHICKLIDRPNRFLGRVDLEGAITEVFIPNPGRMHELMIPGRDVYIREAARARRRTRYDMIGMQHDGVLVSIDSYLPNRFMKDLLEKGAFAGFEEYDSIISEPRVYDGRFDFRLERVKGIAFIEVKSCTLVDDGHARFPDAPTSRGTRHVRSLMRAKDEGLAERVAVVFVIQRPDAVVFSPNDDTDPEFGEALREAHGCGVEIYALACKVENWNLQLVGRVPVDLREHR